MSRIKKGSVELMKKDILVVSELTEWMRAYVWAVDACGGDGEIEMAEIKEYATKAVKALVNYL